MDHATIEDIGLVLSGEDSQPFIDAVNEYLQSFAKPVDGGKCINCGTMLTGKSEIEAVLLGSFRWGIAHGEGACSDCGWPARAYHNLPGADGEPLLTRPLPLVLQYHESAVEKKERVS